MTGIELIAQERQRQLTDNAVSMILLKERDRLADLIFELQFNDKISQFLDVKYLEEVRAKLLTASYKIAGN